MAPAKVCSIPDCDKKAIARGWCSRHWTRWRKHGDPEAPPQIKPITKDCEAPGCDRKAVSCWQDNLELCNKHWLRIRKHGDLRRRHAKPQKVLSPCSVEGCEKLANRIGAGLCEKHYYRKRRNGHTDLLLEVEPPPKTVEHSHGYLLEYAPDHPLAVRLGGASRVYQHRRVFYDENGEGPFRCHWCNIHVTWDDMHVDHVNAIRDDNRIENLVSSCALCNQKRGYEKMVRTSRERRAEWIEFRGERLTLQEWAQRLGINRVSLTWRLKRGWPLDRALTEGRGKFGPEPKNGSEA